MAVRANPRFSIPWLLRAAVLAKTGRIDEAKASAQRVLDLEPEFSISRLLATKFTSPERVAMFGDALCQAGLPE
jgi:adenylate cyclase